MRFCQNMGNPRPQRRISVRRLQPGSKATQRVGQRAPCMLWLRSEIKTYPKMQLVMYSRGVPPYRRWHPFRVPRLMIDSRR